MVLKQIPTQEDLMRLYWELSQMGAPCIGEKKKWAYHLPPPRHSKEELVSLACEMVRYDPRLLSILIIYLIEHWQELNPLHLRKACFQIKTPQVVGVLKEFILEYSQGLELKYFLEYVVKGLRPVSPQLFFIGLFSIGSHKHELMAQRSLKQYLKWGFLGRERPLVNLVSKQAVGTYDFQTRKKIIFNILRAQKSFSLKEYLGALDHTISRQQALYDLKHFRNLKLTGHGRGAKWKLVA